MSILCSRTTSEFELLVLSCDRRMVKRIRRLLSGSSWRCFCIRDADSIDVALGMLARKPAEVVLLDLELPGDRGMLTLVGLRQALASVPVVALGKHNDVGLGVLSLRHGAQDCIRRDRLDESALVRSIRFAVERQRREQSLHEYIRELNGTEGQLHALLQMDADGHVVVNSDGTILYANPAAEDLFGRDEADLRGSPFGFPVVGQDLEPIHIVRKGGPPVTVEMRVAQSEWDGEPAFVVSLRDVSARRITERDLLRATFSSLEGAVLITDLSGRIVLANPAAEQLAGWTTFGVIGELLDEIARISCRATGHTQGFPTQAVMQEGRPVTVSRDAELVDRQGRWRSVYARGTPVRVADGEIIGSMWTFAEPLQAGTGSCGGAHG